MINLGEPGAGKSVSMQEPATKMPPGVTVIGKETPPAGTNMDFAKLIREYKLEIRGVVNVGAHLGNDMIQYDTAGIKNVMLLEPHPQIFERLRLQYELQADCRNVALAENAGNLQLYLSTGDDGRSNSLMWPKIHNSQYPNIKYNGQITVLSNTFEGLGVDIGKYNAMHVDVNGYELTAIKGALTFMPHCDFIYTRIYYAELFESNAMVTEVDMYLKQFGFERVHTTKEGQTWGFALYIKNTNKSFPGKLKTEHFSDVPAEALQNQYLSSTPENDFVANVPPQFRPHIRKPVPANNTLPFEEWYYSKFAFADQVENMVYLPVFWNSYYSNHNVQSSGDAAVERLQRFIETLDPEKQYYTICMHPGGILNDTRKLKLKVFGVKPHVPEYHISYVVLPMACQPHGFVFTDVEKDLFISYVGPQLHPVRKELFELLPADNKKVYISSEQHSLQEYCRILARSRYVICPTGYKTVNFRMAEALQYGAIPIIYHAALNCVYDPSVYFDVDPQTDKQRFIEDINEMETLLGGCILTKESDEFIIDRAKYTALAQYKSSFTFDAIKEEIISELKQ